MWLPAVRTNTHRAVKTLVCIHNRSQYNLEHKIEEDLIEAATMRKALLVHPSSPTIDVRVYNLMKKKKENELHAKKSQDSSKLVAAMTNRAWPMRSVPK